ncbi:MAG: ABC transporter substrate-binding protein [Rhodobacteraceae bacterium]|nr:ABC transporter substrate-binding protein [Paracoccaceae bacterium]
MAIDDSIVRVTTKNPDPALLARLATVMGQIYPQAYYESVGMEVFGREPVGTGSYMWGGRVTGESVTLNAFDGYWGETPPLNSITFLEVPENSARIAGLLTGEYDIITSLPPDQIFGTNWFLRSRYIARSRLTGCVKTLIGSHILSSIWTFAPAT